MINSWSLLFAHNFGYAQYLMLQSIHNDTLQYQSIHVSRCPSKKDVTSDETFGGYLANKKPTNAWSCLKMFVSRRSLPLYIDHYVYDNIHVVYIFMFMYPHMVMLQNYKIKTVHKSKNRLLHELCGWLQEKTIIMIWIPPHFPVTCKYIPVYSGCWKVTWSTVVFRI